MNIEQVIEKTTKLLSENTEWEDRYHEYIKDIYTNYSTIAKNTLIKTKGLSLYTSISNRKKKEYDLRFRGQSVATIKEVMDLKGKITVELLPKLDKNYEYFGIESKNKLDWNSDEAQDFIAFFKKESLKFTTEFPYTDRKYPKSEEHHVENCLLREFSKKSSIGKALCNIQPITLYDLFFQMPTPLSASGKELKYAKQYGGGIDILTRIKRGNKSHICVMEVKDENKPEESQAKAMSQAVSYAVFIAHLLHSNSGQLWWDFFMRRNLANNETKKRPNDISINVVTIMPKGNTEEYCNTEGIEISTLNGVKLYCHSLYYDKEAFDKDETFKFSGTFNDYLNPCR